MNQYIIKELQNANSTREGTHITATSLTQAKNAAERARFYSGTVLVIESTNGTRLATKTNGVWNNE